MSRPRFSAKTLLVVIVVALVYFFAIYRNGQQLNKQSIDHRSLEVWAANNNRSDLLDLPLCEFIVNTSHNTYISGWQVGSNVSSDNIAKVLETGARCIELDIHANKNALANQIVSHYSNAGGLSTSTDEPIVAHGNDLFIDLDFMHLTKALKVIKENAFKTTSDPLIIYLEVFDSDNEKYMQNINRYINEYLGQYLYECTLDKLATNYNQYFLKVPIKQLLNRIVIVINYYNMKSLANRNLYLNPVAHGFTDEPENGILKNEANPLIAGAISSANIIKSPSNQVKRVYPDDIVTSKNYNPDPFWVAGYTFVAMNFFHDGDNIDKNIKKFTYTNFVPKHEVVGDDGKIRGDNGFYSVNGVDLGKLYFNITADSAIIVPNRAYYGDSYWFSQTREYCAIMQQDGNLVVYDTKNKKSKWSSRTSGNPNAILAMQPDGNLVIYDKNKRPVWSSNTLNKDGAYAGLDKLGRLFIYDYNGTPIKLL